MFQPFSCMFTSLFWHFKQNKPHFIAFPAAQYHYYFKKIENSSYIMCTLIKFKMTKYFNRCFVLKAEVGIKQLLYREPGSCLPCLTSAQVAVWLICSAFLSWNLPVMAPLLLSTQLSQLLMPLASPFSTFLYIYTSQRCSPAPFMLLLLTLTSLGMATK